MYNAKYSVVMNYKLIYFFILDFQIFGSNILELYSSDIFSEYIRHEYSTTLIFGIQVSAHIIVVPIKLANSTHFKYSPAMSITFQL